MPLKSLLFTFSSRISGRNKDMGSAVITAKERTSIKSVVKWLIPSSECARAKLIRVICFNPINIILF
tara:strand:+ start:246 stop:446 length:201 start_codon:yes stop_codon:yes gene_type:complete